MTNEGGLGLQGVGGGICRKQGVVRPRTGRAAVAAIVLVLTIFAGVSMVPPAQAQPPVEWTRQFGAIGRASDLAYAADSDGNAYVAGYAEGTLAEQTSAGGADAFLRKHDANGGLLWTRQFGTVGSDAAFGVAAVGSSVYVGGYACSAAFPGQYFWGICDAFVRKYDVSGNVLWTRQFGSIEFDQIHGVAADPTGVYAAGHTCGALPWQANAGNCDAFVRKYDESGNELWTRQFGTATYDEATGISVSSADVYVTGHTYGAFPQQENAGYNDVFVMKFDADGNVLWTRQFASSAPGQDVTFAVDASGNIYVAGYTNGVFPGETPSGPLGGNDAFVRKYNPSGDVLWTRQFGTSSDDFANGVATDGSNVYVAGQTAGTFPGQTYAGSYDAFVRKYDVSGGALWTRQFGTTREERALGVSADMSSVYVAGFTYGALPGGGGSAGGADAFLRKYDVSGGELWTRQFGTAVYSDQASSVAIGPSGVYVGGVFHSDYFGDAFVRKYDADGNVRWTAEIQSGGREETLGVAADASGVYLVGSTSGTLPGGGGSAGYIDAFVSGFDASGNYRWTRQFGSAMADSAFGVDVDASGVYVAGYTSGVLPGQVGVGNADAFLRKYDASGNSLWTRQFGTSAYDVAYGVAVDASAVYVAGYTQGTFAGQAGGVLTADGFVRRYDASGAEAWTRQFGTFGAAASDVGQAIDVVGDVFVAGYVCGELPGETALGGCDAFVRKYDPDGSVVWTRQLGTSSYDIARALAVDDTAVYIAGYTEGIFPGQTGVYGSDAFVVKLDASGSLLWIRQFGTPYSDQAFGVAVDSSGEYVVGTTCGAFPGQPSIGDCDAFIRKLDPAGSELWTVQFGSAGPATDSASALDASGNVYVAGSTDGTFPGQTRVGGTDAFVRKYDGDGNVQWTRQFGTPSNEQAYAIAADASSVYVVGYTEGLLPGAGGSVFDAFVRKYDGDGNVQWTRQFGSSTSYDWALAVTLDASGVYVAGYTQGALPAQSYLGSYDAFVRKYDTSGNELWTHQFGTSNQDQVTGIAPDDSGVYLSGFTYGSFPGGNSAGYADAFVRKYDPSGDEEWTRQFGTSSFDWASGVAADSSGVYLTGTLSGATFVRKYDASGGLQWTRELGVFTYNGASWVAVDSSIVYLTGSVYGTLPGQVNQGGWDAFVAAFDASGSNSCDSPMFIEFGTSGLDIATGVSVDASAVYVVGYTDGEFPGQTRAGYRDAFLARLAKVASGTPVISSFVASALQTPEGSPVTFTANACDPEGDSLTFSFDLQDDGVFEASGPSNSVALAFPDDGMYQVRVRVSDGTYSADGLTRVQATNLAPTAILMGPEPGAIFPVDTPVAFTGALTDPGTADTHSGYWGFYSSEAGFSTPATITESGGSGTVSDTFAFPVPGIYNIYLSIRDDDGAWGYAYTIGDASAFIVVYDPAGGFATGGGWFFSWWGSYGPDYNLAGKATFGFVARYTKGSSTPTGNVEFQFHEANMNFKSTSLSWLLISWGRARIGGTGTINGQGNYAFILYAVDSDWWGQKDYDRFRIRIWDMGSADPWGYIYDNEYWQGPYFYEEPYTVIDGSIVVHDK